MKPLRIIGLVIGVTLTCFVLYFLAYFWYYLLTLETTSLAFMFLVAVFMNFLSLAAGIIIGRQRANHFIEGFDFSFSRMVPSMTGLMRAKETQRNYHNPVIEVPSARMDHPLFTISPRGELPERASNDYPTTEM